MRSSGVAVALLVLASTGHGRHGQVQDDEAAPDAVIFSMPVEANEQLQRSGPTELALTYLKYGTPIPPELDELVGERLDTASNRQRKRWPPPSAPLSSQLGFRGREYLIEAQLGTPAQRLNLLLDTGSSDFWVFSTNTPARAAGRRTRYDPSKSMTAHKSDGYTWAVTYGIGSAVGGIVYWDSVTVGRVTVLRHPVESVQVLTPKVELAMSASGVLGLGFDKQNKVRPRRRRTWFSKAKRNFKEPLFTTRLVRDESSSFASLARFPFPRCNSSSGEHSLPWRDTPVLGNTGLWSWSASGYRVGQSPFQVQDIRGVADTGSSLVLLPRSIVEDYWARVAGAKYNRAAGGYTFPCSATLPDFTFGVKDQMFTISGSDMHVRNARNGSSSAMCFGLIQSNGGGLTVWGNPALQAAFVVWDVGRMRLGWAQPA